MIHKTEKGSRGNPDLGFWRMEHGQSSHFDLEKLFISLSVSESVSDRFRARVPNAHMDHKRLFGIYHDDSIRGCLDCYLNHPNQGSLYIDLILLAPAMLVRQRVEQVCDFLEALGQKHATPNLSVRTSNTKLDSLLAEIGGFEKRGEFWEKSLAKD